MVRTFDATELDRAISAVHDGEAIDAIYIAACIAAGLDPARVTGSPLLALAFALAPEGKPIINGEKLWSK